MTTLREAAIRLASKQAQFLGTRGIARGAALLRVAEEEAARYLRSLPALTCAEDGCKNPRAKGRRYCFGHNGTGPRGIAARGVEEV